MTDEPNDDRPDRKERVLHTRVPAILEQELKRLADAWKVPVSNVVRAILEDAVEAVEVIGKKAEGELHGFAERLQHQRDALRARVAEPRAEPKPSPEPPVTLPCPPEASATTGVLGWRRLVLAAEASCSVCGTALPRGADAMLAEREGDGPRVLVASGCRLLPSQEP